MIREREIYAGKESEQIELLTASEGKIQVFPKITKHLDKTLIQD